ncbi:MAG: hypothetical protein V8S58_12260, partial [Lachnospiraceae bacterium]
TALANLFGVGGASLISRFLGGGERKKASRCGASDPGGRIFRQASFGVAFGGILNMVLDPLFIYGLHLQISGAAVATLISNITAMFYFLAFIRKIRSVSVLTLSPGMYTLGEHIPAEVISVGMPSFLISMIGTVSNMVLNHIIAGYSNVAVAGMGIAKKLNMLAFAVGQGNSGG